MLPLTYYKGSPEHALSVRRFVFFLSMNLNQHTKLSEAIMAIVEIAAISLDNFLPYYYQ